MICAIKAEATASGLVDSVIVVNRNGGPTEQIADLEGLISQGVDAIILNPTDREGLNAVIESAIAQGIVVVAVDQAVTAEGAYVATNDQTAYAQLGAEWLFEQLGGSGQSRGDARHRRRTRRHRPPQRLHGRARELPGHRSRGLDIHRLGPFDRRAGRRST